MGISERKEKEKEIRRNDIIEAAERVFFSKGYSVATMDDVAREAEFSKRTVYVYFNSKEQLYFEIMVRGYQHLIAMMKTELQKTEGLHALDRIKQIGRTLHAFSNLYPDHFTAIMEYENSELDFDKGIPDESREACYALGEKVLQYLINVLSEGIEEGVIRDDLDVVNTALALWSCTLGVFNTVKKKKQYIMNYHQRNPEELVSTVFELLTKAIQSEDGGDGK